VSAARVCRGTRQLQETFNAAARLETFTAPELADELNIKLPNLHARLNALLDAGALSREPDDTVERGKRFRYAAPSMTLVDAK
jgi:DNA-binding MarR family transcriptional regulator